MSKRQFKSQASSSRAATSAFGGGFGSSTFSTASSPLSYITEPPNLSGISDSHLVVSFKNLSKKDSTTKAKALEELQTYISSGQELEEATLEAWIKLYPRTSIDNARQVRQRAHAVQGQISVACGKRIAKHLPEVVAAWLSGLYDNDKSVTKSAQDSFALVFNSPEKLHNLRKAYQAAILEYCRNVIETETVLTLSDERTTSPDDAESKYARVVSAAIGVIGDLLDALTAEETLKDQDQYDEALSNEKLWELVSHKDTAVRRSVLRLLRTCLAKQPKIIEMHLKAISKSLLAHGLNSDQTGTSYDFMGSLIQLTKAHPTLWTEHYSGKKSADHRLRSFLKRGSQFGPKEFWMGVPQLLQSIPDPVKPTTVSEVTDFLSAMHSGIIKKDEPRMNIPTAYDSYISVAGSVVTRLDKEDQQKILQELLFPLVPQHINPSPDVTDWSLPGPSAVATILKAANIDVFTDTLITEWPIISQEVINAIKSSAPEQAKDFTNSQDLASDKAKRWAVIGANLLKNSRKDLKDVVQESFLNLVSESAKLLVSRNAKPYCAAAAIANSLRVLPTEQKGVVLSQLEEFLCEDIPQLILSPSTKHLISILYLSKDSSKFAEAWSKTLKRVIAEPESPTKMAAIEELFGSSDMPTDFDIAAADENLQSFIIERLKTSLTSDDDWPLFGRVLKYSDRLLAPTTADNVLVEMTKGLSLTEKSNGALHAIEQVARQNPAMLRDYIPTVEGTNLLRALLLLGESADEKIAQEASSLSTSIQALLTQDSSDPSSKKAVLDVIQEGLSEATASSVTIETLVELAVKTLSDAAMDQKREVAVKLLPSKKIWSMSLQPFLQIPPNASFAITSPLAGSIYLIEQTEATGPPGEQIARDVNGFSSAYRIASFFVSLLKDTEVSQFLDIEIMAMAFEYLALTIILTNDNLGIAGSNSLWSNYTPAIEADALDFVSDAQKLISGWLHKSSKWWGEEVQEGEYAFVNSALQEIIASIDSATSKSFYSARAYSTIVAELIETHGWQSKSTEVIENNLRDYRRKNNVFGVAAYVAGFRAPFSSSKVAERACNEIVADLTGLKVDENPQKTITQLSFLNLMLQHMDDFADKTAKQRVIFLVKHIMEWLQDPELPIPFQAEICRALTSVLPAMKDMYGDHWSESLKFITSTWNNLKQLEDQTPGAFSAIPLVHATLKLYGTLQGLTKDEDPNDDLVDALKDSEKAVASGMINLLKNSQHIPDEFHQPLRIVNELIARHISKLSLKNVDDPSELFPLLYVQSGPVQRTAFDILHKHIPASQEQISIDSVLEKKDAKLPDELLSLVLEAPTMESLANADFERAIPLTLRGYIFSWLLVFDHFESSSYKVKSDYTEHIKEDDYLNPLLNLLSAFLGHSKGKPLDVTSLPITTYTPDALDPPLRDAQALLTHLYYLAALHLPTLTKTWWIECKSRPTVIAMESWTEKYITPHIVAAALSTVSTWADSQDTSEETLAIKTAPRAAELTAAYTIDEQTLSFRIALPPTYPLAPLAVTSIHRVAVSEAKWQNWLRNCAGVIMFSNGSIVDGLVAFRRNVVGTLKGQTECAICYSIVGADRQLPTKRCGTCKNAFHGGCLFKWFKSSGGSSCPLCREAFNYG